MSWLLAIISGLALGASFSPIDLWPLAPLGVAGLTIATRKTTNRQALGLGFAFAVAMFCVTISYIYVLGWWVAALLIAAMSCYGLLLGAGSRALQKLPFWPVGIASLWTLTETIWQRFPLGGFGWVRLGFTTADQPLGGYLHLIGVAGVGWLVGMTGASLAWLVVNVRTEAFRKAAAGVIALLLALFGVGQVLRGMPVDAGGEQVKIGVVQGNVDGTAGPRAMGYARSVVNNHLSETITLLAQTRTGQIGKPDFIVWPENSTDFDPSVDPATALSIKTALDLAGVPIFLGAIMKGPGEGERQTTGLWFSTDGHIEGRYDKRNAVPFGEFTPFAKIVLPLVPLARNVGAQTVTGTEPGILPVRYADKQILLGDIICYELAYDYTVYQNAGWRQPAAPEVMVVQSNNASYTGTFQPVQQFTITRVRAMEMRREIVVSTTSSLSGLIGPRGEVLARSDEATAASTVFSVPRRDQVSLGIQVGPWWEGLASLLGIGLLITCWASGRRSKRAANLDAHEPRSQHS